MVRRERTNTPLQALLLLNEPQFVEASRALAERTLREAGPTTDERLIYMFRLATARRPRNRERAGRFLACGEKNLPRQRRPVRRADTHAEIGKTNQIPIPMSKPNRAPSISSPSLPLRRHIRSPSE